MDASRNNWPHVRQWLIEQIRIAHINLESPALDAVATAHLRGKIAALRLTLKTGDPEDAPELANPSGYY